jgi:hypothetical protein
MQGMELDIMDELAVKEMERGGGDKFHRQQKERGHLLFYSQS